MVDTLSLKQLMKLAQKQSDEAAKKLGKLNIQHQEAEKKLNLLLQYREIYQDRLQHASQGGIGYIEWKNFIIFINKLDNAISEQKLAVKHAENLRDTGNDELKCYQRKLNAYDALFLRHQQSEQQRQRRVEQKTLDEFTTNRFSRHNPNLIK